MDDDEKLVWWQNIEISPVITLPQGKFIYLTISSKSGKNCATKSDAGGGSSAKIHTAWRG
jgi:hypothetical protein